MNRIRLCDNVREDDISDLEAYRKLSDARKQMLRSALAHAADRHQCSVSELRWAFDAKGAGVVPLKVWPPKPQKVSWRERLWKRLFGD